ncbi:MAG: LysR substrate-binding domain-containing protein [Pseudomonadota bacterium]
MDQHARHLRALQAFDVAAALSNLSKAATELGVTHGAVSRQIKQLEDYLGVPLLHRRANGVAKTEQGERLHQATQRAFAALRDGLRDVRRSEDNRSITISLSASLATKWLVPRLAAFRSAHPGLSVFLDTNDEIVDLHASQVDVALRYGTPDWGDVHHELVTREELIVVAAPGFAARHKGPMRPEAIASLPLLNDEFNPAWDRWAAGHGLDPGRVATPAVRFADSAVLIAAAIDGQGVALVRRLLVEDDLQARRLVRLDNSVTTLSRALYIVCRPGDQNRVPVRRFRSWLLSSGLQRS